ncbi:hypothetical protein OPT61_g2975 [Boeremia exigua]|uniref:Uncharacterized protein n=1 Tax=Boeremia exigua TaxID=749465 RepID=A0ACC2IJL4_9PLEO|nr:hypothetical protein OPT61_g2975 [Boeremia exigua]
MGVRENGAWLAFWIESWSRTYSERRDKERDELETPGLGKDREVVDGGGIEVYLQQFDGIESENSAWPAYWLNSQRQNHHAIEFNPENECVQQNGVAVLESVNQVYWAGIGTNMNGFKGMAKEIAPRIW